MKPGSLEKYQMMVQEWENRVKQDPPPSWQEVNEFCEAVGREFCTLPPDYNNLMNLENETSFLHTFGEAVYAFYVFCLKMKEILIWPVRLLHRQEQMRRQ